MSLKTVGYICQKKSSCRAEAEVELPKKSEDECRQHVMVIQGPVSEQCTKRRS